MGPFVTRDRFQLLIWGVQRPMVRSSWFTLGGAGLVLEILS